MFLVVSIFLLGKCKGIDILHEGLGLDLFDIVLYGNYEGPLETIMPESLRTFSQNIVINRFVEGN